MQYLLILLAVLWGLFQITDRLSSSHHSAQGHSLSQFSTPPHHRLVDPYRNAYFHLLGFISASTSEPAKVGYDMWGETDEPSHAHQFDYEKPGRFELRIHSSPAQFLPAWEADDPLEAFRGKRASVRELAAQHHLLLTRYERCLGMPFEDWGFGRPATPRFSEPFLLHRLYVAEGFSLGLGTGLERLHRDLHFWRTVLREATTPATKVMAQVIVRDDVRLVSRALSRPTVDKNLLTIGLQLMLPLTPSEYALRWPIQHQVAVGLGQEPQRIFRDEDRARSANEALSWLGDIANLPPLAFKKIEHPSAQTVFGISVTGEETADIYTAFYEALVNASGPSQHDPPRLHHLAATMHRGMIEHLLLPRLPEPEWGIFIYQLMETDARLRLAGLQIQLRHTHSTIPVPIRLAEVGSQYFDPFTGLPMLWSPTQRRLYSVGKDRLDDGGDPSFDITVPVALNLEPSNTPFPSPTPTVIKKSRRL
jgi:hypothetical protein